MLVRPQATVCAVVWKDRSMGALIFIISVLILAFFLGVISEAIRRG